MAQTTFRMMCQSLWILLTPFPPASLKEAGVPLLSQFFGGGGRVGYSFFPVFRSISCHLLMVWGWRPPILGAPFPCEQPHLGCGKSAGGRSTVFCFDLPQNAQLSSAGDWPTIILSLGTVFSVLSSVCRYWSGFLCSLLDVEAGVFCSGNQVFQGQVGVSPLQVRILSALLL